MVWMCPKVARWIATVVVLAVCAVMAACGTGPRLDSWADGPAKQAIVGFVERTTTPGSAGWVAPAERIAVFDNDGTLWTEQPVYFQLLFAIDRVRAMAPSHPEWREQEPFASLIRGETGEALGQGEHAIAQIVAVSHAGMTADEFESQVRGWFATARHPTTGRRYPEMVYRPMLDLLGYLRAHGYKTYIVSGGGVEFIRGFAEAVYGIPPEQVIGSTGKQRYEVRGGTPEIVKLPEIDFIDDKAGKPLAIQRVIGRRPVAAFGNSDGDFEMLEWTTAGAGPRIGVLVHHDDAAREWAYDRESKIGTLARGLDEAAARGWTVVSMKRDWKVIHPPAR